MKNLKFVMIGGLLFLGACAATPPPQSTITSDELNRLLVGHVLIEHEPQWRGPNGEDARAFYHSKDGTAFGCSMNMRHQKPISTHNNWIATPNNKTVSLFAVTGSLDEKIDHDADIFHPVYFNKATGEWAVWGKDRTGWYKDMVGHVQKSWPAVMLARCPDLKLPAGLPINEKQTAAKYVDLKKQDPDAIILYADLTPGKPIALLKPENQGLSQ